jgi:DeoR family glycerol-3-phosphate regulon repressor
MTSSHSLASDRPNLILERVRRSGELSIDALADEFEVTPQTIRRLVNQLCEDGLLRRIHGGVKAIVPTQNLAYESRQVLNLEAKTVIARAVARFIPDGASLFLGLGTTPECVAAALAAHRDLRVFTNSLNVASVLARHPDVDITIAGGTLRRRDRDIIGSAAVAFFGRFKADYAIFGIGGLDEDGMLLDFEEGEVEARKAMVEGCRTAVLVADTSKFGRNATVRGGHLSDIDHFFTDGPVPQAFAATVAEAKVELHQAAS